MTKKPASNGNKDPAFLCSAHATTVCGAALATQWQEVLREPSLITHKLLCTALRHRPPLRVVQSLLRLNNQAAVCPANESTSALQTALQSSCELPVIRCLLQAWPAALTRASPCDPLTYVKLYRFEEFDLIQLLSRPLEYWCGSSCGSASPGRYTEDDESHGDVRAISSFDSSRSVLMGIQAKQQIADDAWDDENSLAEDSRDLTDSKGRGTQLIATPSGEELANVKSICMAVLRGHRRLTAQLRQLEERNVELSLESREQPPLVDASEHSQLVNSSEHPMFQAESPNQSVLEHSMLDEGQLQKLWAERQVAVDLRIEAMFQQMSEMEAALRQRSPDTTFDLWKDFQPLEQEPSYFQRSASEYEEVEADRSLLKAVRRRPRRAETRNFMSQLKSLLCPLKRVDTDAMSASAETW